MSDKPKRKYAAYCGPDRTRILTKREMRTVLDELHRRVLLRRVYAGVQLTVFRLMTGCGLRVKEASRLEMRDLNLDVERPWIEVRKENGKACKARRVPCWWDAGTLSDLKDWRDLRISEGAQPTDRVLRRQRKRDAAGDYEDRTMRALFRGACRVLGAERLKHLTAHDGRHTFATHALQAGRTLAEVRDALGHSSISTTGIYLHLIEDSDRVVPDLYAR